MKPILVGLVLALAACWSLRNQVGGGVDAAAGADDLVLTVQEGADMVPAVDFDGNIVSYSWEHFITTGRYPATGEVGVCMAGRLKVDLKVDCQVVLKIRLMTGKGFELVFPGKCGPNVIHYGEDAVVRFLDELCSKGALESRPGPPSQLSVDVTTRKGE